MDAFTDRIYGAVREIAREDTGETILIVTHGMAMRRSSGQLVTGRMEQALSETVGLCNSNMKKIHLRSEK